MTVFNRSVRNSVPDDLRDPAADDSAPGIYGETWKHICSLDTECKHIGGVLRHLLTYLLQRPWATFSLSQLHPQLSRVHVI